MIGNVMEPVTDQLYSNQTQTEYVNMIYSLEESTTRLVVPLIQTFRLGVIMKIRKNSHKVQSRIRWFGQSIHHQLLKGFILKVVLSM